MIGRFAITFCERNDEIVEEKITKTAQNTFIWH